MTFPLSGYIGAGALVAGLLGGWTVRDWKADSDEAKAKDRAFVQYQALTETLADQSLAYEVLAQSLRAGERADRETIRETFRNVEVPAVCTPPAAIGSLLDNAVKRANSAASGELIGPMPTSSPTPR